MPLKVEARTPHTGRGGVLLLMLAFILPLVAACGFLLTLHARRVVIIGTDAVVGRVVPASGVALLPVGFSSRSPRYFLGNTTRPCVYVYLRVHRWAYNIAWFKDGLTLHRKGRFGR